MEFSFDFDAVPMDDEWHTVKVIYKDNVATLYIDGKQIKKIAGPLNIKVKE